MRESFPALIGERESRTKCKDRHVKVNDHDAIVQRSAVNEKRSVSLDGLPISCNARGLRRLRSDDFAPCQDRLLGALVFLV
jgi:hypothetical protein